MNKFHHVIVFLHSKGTKIPSRFKFSNLSKLSLVISNEDSMVVNLLPEDIVIRDDKPDLFGVKAYRCALACFLFTRIDPSKLYSLEVDKYLASELSILVEQSDQRLRFVTVTGLSDNEQEDIYSLSTTVENVHVDQLEQFLITCEDEWNKMNETNSLEPQDLIIFKDNRTSVPLKGDIKQTYLKGLNLDDYSRDFDEENEERIESSEKDESGDDKFTIDPEILTKSQETKR